ncbi:MAG: HNH endonuclease [Planctomycetota bacterium]
MEGVAVLDTNVLVLNRLYLAVHVITVRRAFRLLFKEHAEVVEYEDDRYSTYNFESWVELSRLKNEWKQNPQAEWIRAVSFDIRVPRVIRLLLYDRLPKRGVKLNRRNIYARDENLCQYCGRRYSTQDLSLDHVIPRSRGGHSTWENLVCCCMQCNVQKGGRTPREAGLTLIRRPARPRRSPIVTLRLGSARYQSWKQFLDNAYWSVELK